MSEPWQVCIYLGLSAVEHISQSSGICSRIPANTLITSTFYFRVSLWVLYTSLTAVPGLQKYTVSNLIVFSLGMIKAYDMDLCVVRVLAGF